MKFFQKSYGDPIRGRMRVVGMEWERELPCTSNTLMTKLNELAILSSDQQLGISKRDGASRKSGTITISRVPKEWLALGNNAITRGISTILLPPYRSNDKDYAEKRLITMN